MSTKHWIDYHQRFHATCTELLTDDISLESAQSVSVSWLSEFDKVIGTDTEISNIEVYTSFRKFINRETNLTWLFKWNEKKKLTKIFSNKNVSVCYINTNRREQ